MLQAQPRAKFRKRKAKFKPALFAPARDATENYTNERRKFKPHSAAARMAHTITNLLRQSAARMLARRAILDRVIAAKFKELLNFKVRRILRILKFTALKFHSLR